MKLSFFYKLLFTLSLLLGNVSYAKEYDDIILHFFEDHISPSIKNDNVLPIFTKANNEHMKLSSEDKSELEKLWQIELESENYTILPTLLTHRSAIIASRLKEEAKGSVSSVVFVSTEGLNVGQSDVTKNYNQTENPLWIKIHENHASHVIGDVEYDNISGNFIIPAVFSIEEDDMILGYIFADFDAVELEYLIKSRHTYHHEEKHDNNHKHEHYHETHNDHASSHSH